METGQGGVGSASSPTSPKKKGGPVLLEDVEELIGKMVKQQTRELKKMRKEFDKEKKDFDDQRNKITKSLNLKKVKLNVGGKIYVTSLSTLTKLEDSLLCEMFSGRYPIEPDENGEFFLDRNGKLFGFILDYLRNGELDVPEDDHIFRRQIQREAEYFNITPLMKTLSSRRDGVEIEWSLDSSYCSANIVLSNNAMTAINIGEGHAYVIGSKSWDKGQHAWKCEVSIPNSPHWILLGVSKQKRHKDNSYSDPGVWGLSSCNQHYLDGVVSTVSTNIQHGDSVHMMLDCDKGILYINNVTSGWKDQIPGLPSGSHVPHFNIYDKCTGFTLTPIYVEDFGKYPKRKKPRKRVL